MAKSTSILEDEETTAYQLTSECKRFIAASPFLLIASASRTRGADISPRGDMPGFVQTDGANTLLLPDRIGNNRVDTMSNLFENPRVGLVFFIPSDESVLAIQGDAQISTDPDLLQRFAVKAKPPKTVMKIVVTCAVKQTARSLAASGFWSSGHSSGPPSFPTLGDILADQVGGVSKDDANEFVNQSYKQRLY